MITFDTKLFFEVLVWFERTLMCNGWSTLALSHLIEIHHKYKLSSWWGKVTEDRKSL